MNNSKQKDFMDLYSPIHESFIRFCKAKSYGIIEYEDLINETILRAYSSFESLKNKKAFLGFLFGIASNIIKNSLRRKDFISYKAEYNSNIEDVSYSLERKHDIELLYKALNQLPEKTKEAIILFEISGFSIKEISEIQDSSNSAIKQRLKRGRESLSTILGVKDVNKTTSPSFLSIMFTL